MKIVMPPADPPRRKTRNLSCLRQIRRGGKLEIRSWKLGTAGLLILVFPMLASSLLAQASDTGNAVEGYRLVCDEPVSKFGHVAQSAVITNVFTVRNEGDLSFMLKYVQTSCSCTKGKMDKRVIGPDETAQLTAVYTAARRKGPQKKSLKLIPVDSNKPALVLHMEGFVDVFGGSR